MTPILFHAPNLFNSQFRRILVDLKELLICKTVFYTHEHRYLFTLF